MALYARALAPSEIALLQEMASCEMDQEMSKRARIVLLSAARQRVHEISASVGLHPINVRKWIHRFNHYGLDGLEPRRSPGRPPLFKEGQRQAIINLAMADPRLLGLGFSAWSLQRLRAQLMERGIVDEISAETIRQELLRAGLVFEGRRWVYGEGPHALIMHEQMALAA